MSDRCLELLLDLADPGYGQVIWGGQLRTAAALKRRGLAYGQGHLWRLTKSGWRRWEIETDKLAAEAKASAIARVKAKQTAAREARA